VEKKTGLGLQPPFGGLSFSKPLPLTRVHTQTFWEKKALRNVWVKIPGGPTCSPKPFRE